MKNIEIEIKKWHNKQKGEGNRGKWVTKGQLMEQHHYTQPSSCIMYAFHPLRFLCMDISHAEIVGPFHLRSMADRSFQWAASRGLTRTNPQHGEEEARLVLDDWFEHKTEEGQLTEMAGTAFVEDGEL